MLKKIILLMGIFATVVLCADTVQQYQSAIKYYKNKDYESSYKILSKIYLSNLSDPKLNFYLGCSAYETGRYEIALAAFERVEMLDEGNLRNRLEMAKTFYMLKMYEESQMAFEEVLANPNIPKNVRTNIELYLSKVKGVQKDSFTYATINLDWIYDSNVNYGQLHDKIGGGLVATPEISDNALQAYGDVTNVYDIGQKSGFFIKNRFIGLLKDYQHEDGYDIGYIAYTPSLVYKSSRDLGELVFGADILSIGKKDYLHTYSAMTRYEYAHNMTLKSMLHLKYLQKDFKRSWAYDLDANHYEIAYGLQKILSPRSYVQGEINGCGERKKHGNRTDVDYDEYKFNLNYANQITSRIGLEIFAQYRKRNYKENAKVVYSTKRVDDGGVLAANLNFRIIQRLLFHIKGYYTRVESNQNQFSYQKHTIAVGLNKTF